VDTTRTTPLPVAIKKATKARSVLSHMPAKKNTSKRKDIIMKDAKELLKKILH